MTAYEFASVLIGVAQLLVIGAGLALMEAGGRRRAKAEERRHAETMAAITTQREQTKEQHEQVMAQHEQAKDHHAETMAALQALVR